MIVPVELPRNTGTDGDGVAQNEADHFEKCPVCSQWFDMRDLVQVAEHIHGGSEIEVLEGPGPPPREGCAYRKSSPSI
jgi:hypothetical protein